MHVTIGAPQHYREWVKTGWFEPPDFAKSWSETDPLFGGYWDESWRFQCSVVFTEEEKSRLAHFDDSFTLYKEHNGYQMVEISVPSFVESVSPGKPPFKLRSKGQAEAYITRLKTEILPRLKKLTEDYEPSKDESFEL